MELWHLSEKDFFADMPAEKDDFLTLAVAREVKRNETIFLEGDPGDHCYYLEKGSVKIFRATLVGKEPIFWVRKPGDFFGLAEIIDGKERVCSAKALTRSLIYEIRRKDFETLLERHHAVALKVIAVLGRRLRYLCEQIENLMICDVTERLSRLLVYLSFNHLIFNDQSQAPVSFPLELTQEDIAAMAGSCQQTVSETLKKLQQEGLIRVSRKEITIVKPSELLRRLFH